MKNIMVVFTGGTIGSINQGSSINVNDAGSYMIIEQYHNQYDQGVGFDTMQPMNILSENLLAEQWILLAQQIKSIPQDQYEAIIVTHGSDTLAYSAAMLSYLLTDVKIPIILIASNYPLGDERANGLRNFAEAIAWVRKGAPRGVFVVYENNLGQSKVYIGTRIMQCETFTDQFRSPYELTLGELHGGELTLAEHARNPELTSLSKAIIPLAWQQKIGQITAFHHHIMYIKPYPGLNYHYYAWNEHNKPRAVVHDLYHSGTACSVQSGAYSLPQFIRRCKELDIDVYLTPVKDAAEAKYASTSLLVEAGAILLEGISAEALMTKLMLIYEVASSKQEIEQLVKQAIYFEYH